MAQHQMSCYTKSRTGKTVAIRPHIPMSAVTFCETRWLPSKCMAFGPGHQLDGWQIENEGYSLYLCGVEILKRVESRWQDMTPLQHTFLPPPQTPPLSLSLSIYNIPSIRYALYFKLCPGQYTTKNASFYHYSLPLINTLSSR